MRRPTLMFLVVLGFVSAIGIGYLGYQSAQSQVELTPEAPVTLPVSMGDVVQTVNAPGKLENSKEAHIGMEVSGPLAELLVQPGEAVEAGQLLATLANEDELLLAVEDAKTESATAQVSLQDLIDNAPTVAAQAQLELANAQEALRQAEYKNLVQQEGNRASSETIAAAEATLVLAQEEVRRAESEYAAFSGKPEDHPGRAQAKLMLAEARKSLNRALANLNWYLGHPSEVQQGILDAEVAIAETNLAAAIVRWERVKDGPDPYQLGHAEAVVSQAEARLARAEADLAAVELFAPFDGVIMEVNAKVGDRMAANAGFITLADLSELEVAVSVIEEDLPQVEVGQVVELYFDARPDAQWVGRVERIVPKRLLGDRPLYAVYISVEELPDDLLPGMTADASIITSIRENVLRLPKSLVRARSDGSAEVEVWENGLRHERTVRVGLRGDSTIEILSGLSEGDQVIGE